MSGELFKKFSEKYNGIYRGKIIDNIDPDQLGRCKIQVYPMFSEITEAEELPWVKPAMPLFEGAGTGIGSFCVPDIDTFVFCFFEEGDIYQGVYFAEAQTAGKGLPSDIVTNYPNRKVIKTSSGITFITDDTAKQVIVKTVGGIVGTIDDIALTVKLEHPTGTYILVDATGKVHIVAVDDINVTTTKNANVTAAVDANITATGNVIITGGTSVQINPV